MTNHLDQIKAGQNAAKPKSISVVKKPPLPPADPLFPKELSCRFILSAKRFQTLSGDFFKGFDKKHSQDVLLQVFPKEIVAAVSFDKIEAMIQELIKLQHENILTPLGMGQDKDRLYITYEYCEGEPLGRFYDFNNPDAPSRQSITLKFIFQTVSELCNCLDYIHKTRPHGFLTPQNILMTPNQKVKILGLDLRYFSSDFDFVKTPDFLKSGYYIDPVLVAEKFKNPTVRNDLYSIGIQICEMFSGAYFPDIPKPLRLAAPIVEFLKSCLSEVLGNRFKNALELKEELLQLIYELRLAEEAQIVEDDLQAFSNGTKGLIPDEKEEQSDVAHWLIKKGNLEYGPFSLNQVRQQIIKGECHKVDRLVHMKTGQEAECKDLSDLAEAFVSQAEERIIAERVNELSFTEQRKKKKRRLLLGVISGLVILGIGIAGFMIRDIVFDPSLRYKMLSVKASGYSVQSYFQEIQTDHRLKDAYVEKEIERLRKEKDQKAKARLVLLLKQKQFTNAEKKGKTSAKSSVKLEEENVTDLGDVTQDGSGKAFSMDDFKRVWYQHFNQVSRCVVEAINSLGVKETIYLQFTIKPDGRPILIRVTNPNYQNSSMATCLGRQVSQIVFKRFDGVNKTFTIPFHIRF